MKVTQDIYEGCRTFKEAASLATHESETFSSQMFEVLECHIIVPWEIQNILLRIC